MTKQSRIEQLTVDYIVAANAEDHARLAWANATLRASKQGSQEAWAEADNAERAFRICEKKTEWQKSLFECRAEIEESAYRNGLTIQEGTEEAWTKP